MIKQSTGINIVKWELQGYTHPDKPFESVWFQYDGEEVYFYTKGINHLKCNTFADGSCKDNGQKQIISINKEHHEIKCFYEKIITENNNNNYNCSKDMLLFESRTSESKDINISLHKSYG